MPAGEVALASTHVRKNVPSYTTWFMSHTYNDEEPLIINRYQNDQANLAKLEIKQFRRKEFEVVTEGRFNIDLFETFTLSNDRIISDSDSGANTIDLVAKEITYSIDKPESGVGGFMRTIRGIKRFS